RGSAYGASWGTNKGTIGTSTGLDGIYIFTQTSSQDIEFAAGNVSDVSMFIDASDGSLNCNYDLNVDGEIRGAPRTLQFGRTGSYSSSFTTYYANTPGGVACSATRGVPMVRSGSIIEMATQVNITSVSSNGD